MSSMQADILKNSNYRNRRRGRDRAPFGFVVKADVAADNRQVKSARRVAQTFDSFNELPHDFGALRITVVKAVGNSRRARSGAGDIAHRLAYGRNRSQIWIKCAGTRTGINF